MMQELMGDRLLTDCNPRSPYLVLVWMLIGSDNEYRICQYVDARHLLKQVAIIHIRIVLGDVPAYSVKKASEAARNVSHTRVTKDATWTAWCATAWVADTALWAATIHATDLIRGAAHSTLFAVKDAEEAARMSGVAANSAKTAISAKARQWAHISDEEALQIARQLMLDILCLKSDDT